MSRSPSKGGSEAVTLTVRIQPRASKNGIVRMEDGSLKIRLTAPPVDGAANEALVKFLAGIFSIAQSQVEIVSGHTSRAKRVRINGVDEEDVNGLLKIKAK
jgi:uncharacterized protein